MIKKFLQLFKEHRDLMELVNTLGDSRYQKMLEIEHLMTVIAQKEKAQDLSAAIIQGCRKDIAALQSKIVSDANLIESLNRYVATLETKSNHQTELLQDMKRQLEALLAANANK